MWSLLKAAAVLGVLAAFLFVLPFGGRTLADRWRAADGGGDFISRTWAEMRGAPRPASPPAARAPRAKVHARAAGPRPGEPPGSPPVEGHTEADRQELDRLLGEHLAGAPKR